MPRPNNQKKAHKENPIIEKYYQELLRAVKSGDKVAIDNAYSKTKKFSAIVHPVVLAIESGTVPVFEMLMPEEINKKNIVVNATHLDTPFHLAAKRDRIDIIIALLKRTDLCNLKNKDGYTPLDIAAMHGNKNAFICFAGAIEKQGKVADIFANGALTPLRIARDANKHDLVSYILDRWKRWLLAAVSHDNQERKDELHGDINTAHKIFEDILLGQIYLGNAKTCNKEIQDVFRLCLQPNAPVSMTSLISITLQVIVDKKIDKQTSCDLLAWYENHVDLSAMKQQIIHEINNNRKREYLLACVDELVEKQKEKSLKEMLESATMVVEDAEGLCLHIQKAIRRKGSFLADLLVSSMEEVYKETLSQLQEEIALLKQGILDEAAELPTLCDEVKKTRRALHKKCLEMLDQFPTDDGFKDLITDTKALMIKQKQDIEAKLQYAESEALVIKANTLLKQKWIDVPQKQIDLLISKKTTLKQSLQTFTQCEQQWKAEMAICKVMLDDAIRIGKQLIAATDQLEKDVLALKETETAIIKEQSIQHAINTALLPCKKALANLEVIDLSIIDEEIKITPENAEIYYALKQAIVDGITLLQKQVVAIETSDNENVFLICDLAEQSLSQAMMRYEEAKYAVVSCQAKYMNDKISAVNALIEQIHADILSKPSVGDSTEDIACLDAQKSSVIRTLQRCNKAIDVYKEYSRLSAQPLSVEMHNAKKVLLACADEVVQCREDYFAEEDRIFKQYSAQKEQAYLAKKIAQFHSDIYKEMRYLENAIGELLPIYAKDKINTAILSGIAEGLVAKQQQIADMHNQISTQAYSILDSLLQKITQEKQSVRALRIKQKPVQQASLENLIALHTQLVEALQSKQKEAVEERSVEEKEAQQQETTMVPVNKPRRGSRSPRNITVRKGNRLPYDPIDGSTLSAFCGKEIAALHELLHCARKGTFDAFATNNALLFGVATLFEKIRNVARDKKMAFPESENIVRNIIQHYFREKVTEGKTAQLCDIVDRLLSHIKTLGNREISIENGGWDQILKALCDTINPDNSVLDDQMCVHMIEEHVFCLKEHIRTLDREGIDVLNDNMLLRYDVAFRLGQMEALMEHMKLLLKAEFEKTGQYNPLMVARHFRLQKLISEQFMLPYSTIKNYGISMRHDDMDSIFANVQTFCHQALSALQPKKSGIVDAMRRLSIVDDGGGQNPAIVHNHQRSRSKSLEKASVEVVAKGVTYAYQ